MIGHLARYPKFKFALVMFLMTVFFGVGGIGERSRTRRNLADSYQGSALVQSKGSDSTEWTDRVTLDLEYQDRQGAIHHTKVVTTNELWQKASVGQSVKILVSGLDPEDVWLAAEGKPSYQESWILFGISSLFALLMLFALGVAWEETRAGSRLSIIAQLDRKNEDQPIDSSNPHRGSGSDS